MSPETSVTKKTTTEKSNVLDDVAGEWSIEAAIEQTRCVVETLVRALVDEPEAVAIKAVQGGQAVIFEVAVHPEDVRRIVGRKGRTADACRELLTNLGSKAGRRFHLEIVEPKERAQRTARHA